MIRGISVALALAACASAAQAQTRPAVTSLGPDYPKITIVIGNSFFYYNNVTAKFLQQVAWDTVQDYYGK